jgi:hypothetical protein
MTDETCRRLQCVMYLVTVVPRSIEQLEQVQLMTFNGMQTHVNACSSDNSVLLSNS